MKTRVEPRWPDVLLPEAIAESVCAEASGLLGVELPPRYPRCSTPRYWARKCRSITNAPSGDGYHQSSAIVPFALSTFGSSTSRALSPSRT